MIFFVAKSKIDFNYRWRCLILIGKNDKNHSNPLSRFLPINWRKRERERGNINWSLPCLSSFIHENCKRQKIYENSSPISHPYQFRCQLHWLFPFVNIKRWNHIKVFFSTKKIQSLEPIFRPGKYKCVFFSLKVENFPNSIWMDTSPLRLYEVVYICMYHARTQAVLLTHAQIYDG